MIERYETEDIPGDYGLPIRTEITRDNGGKLPAGMNYVVNRTGRPILISPYLRQRKRQPIVKVRRNDVSIDGTLTVKSWKWECRICKQTWWSLRWWTTQNSATHHAHNHH